ncbi:MAG: DUF3570 domain-containing protein [Steroidobacteraceae bacterium]
MSRSAVRARSLLALLPLVAALWAAQAHSAVLPEDRADILWHRYSGGGVTIQGPSILVRKGFAERVSFSANWYEDMVSSASVDVKSYASPYKEKRTQYSLGADYVRGKTTYSIGYTNSDEPDYVANTAFASISQDLFGDLTTITLGYQRGWNTVGQRDAPAFSERTDTRNYQIGLSQIITKNLIIGASYEAITDEGYLNNPYRSVRSCDDTACTTASFQAERYPRTHTSNAAAVRARYHLPWRAAVYGEYRFYTDTWKVHAHTAQIGYTYPWKDDWVFDANFRYYTQTQADFYSDLFPRANFANFLARDKELSTFNSQSIGLEASYRFLKKDWHFLKKGTVNLHLDIMQFHYDNFRNIPAGGAPGTEPLYSFTANVTQLFFSFWF